MRRVSAGSERARLALTRAAAIGPYFVVHDESGEYGGGEYGGDEYESREYDGGEHGGRSPSVSPRELCDPARLGPLVEAVGEKLGTKERRVAASTLQFGLAARLWSVVLGAWVSGDLVVDLAGLRYRIDDTITPVLTDPVGWAGVDVPAGIAATVVGQLTTLHHGIHSVARIADDVLWGNAAAAVVGAVTAIHAARCDDGRLDATASAVLDLPPLAGRIDGTLGGPMTRRSCCLYYRVPGGGMCGDCPLT